MKKLRKTHCTYHAISMVINLLNRRRISIEFTRKKRKKEEFLVAAAAWFAYMNKYIYFK